MANTNNWIERAWKTFDQIFMRSRANKRLDRLVFIIANEFFPYFQHWDPGSEDTHLRPNRDLAELWLVAHRIYFAEDMIRPLLDDNNDEESDEEDEGDDEVPHRWQVSHFESVEP